MNTLAGEYPPRLPDGPTQDGSYAVVLTTGAAPRGLYVFEFDFLPVTSSTGEGTTKSGDAICGRFHDSAGEQRVFVVDAGYQSTGEALVDHIRRYYETSDVDLAIVTHADGDHINGMESVVDELNVAKLMMHQPRNHAGPRVSNFSNIEAVDSLLRTAARNDTAVTDPFTGETELDDHLLILGPDKEFYEQVLEEHLDDVAETKGYKSLRERARNLLDGALDRIPLVETLTDNGETDPRNEGSVISLLFIDGYRFLLTGDAGQRALARVADEYEAQIGPFSGSPLRMLQVPHHGSRRNLGPTLLDRILGPKHAPYGAPSAIISAGENAPKHPSPKVVNALLRRNATPVVTAGTTIRHHSTDAPARRGWINVTPLPPMNESGEDDD